MANSCLYKAGISDMHICLKYIFYIVNMQRSFQILQKCFKYNTNNNALLARIEQYVLSFKLLDLKEKVKLSKSLL